jgi:hypothetical protein
MLLSPDPDVGLQGARHISGKAGQDIYLFFIHLLRSPEPQPDRPGQTGSHLTLEGGSLVSFVSFFQSSTKIERGNLYRPK